MPPIDNSLKERSALSSWLDRNSLLALSLIFVCSLAVRYLTAEYIDIGGDNTTRWVDCLRVIQGMGFVDWSHHNMRWAIMLPTIGLMKIAGTNPVMYYVLPMVAASLGAVFIYLLGKRLHSAELGLCAAALTILFPQMAQSGSQLWPSVFQFTFAAVSCWAILVWHDTGKTRMLACAALFYFLAWGARTSALYYFPGLLFLIWWPRKDFRAAFVFCVLVGLCIAAEWAFFWFDSGNPLGRIGIIKAAAVNSVETVSLREYLLNPLNLKKLRGLLPIFILTVVAGISLLRSRDKRLSGFAVFYLIFLFFFLYMVSGFSPIRLAQPAGTRYWAAVAPFGLTILLIWLFNIRKRHPRVGTSLIVILFLAFAAFSAKKIPATNTLTRTAEDYRILNPVTTGRQPFLLHWTPWTPNWIEARIFNALGIVKKRQKRPDHIQAAMRRGSHRAVGMFSSNPDDYYLHVKGKLVPVEELSYKFIPYGTPEDAPIGATIFFDRRTAHAVRGEKWPDRER